MHDTRIHTYDTINYSYVYKILEGRNSKTNLLYTPKKSMDGSILCCDYTYDEPYFDKRQVSIEEIEFFYEREVKFLKEFQGKSYCPELLHIDDKKIYIEFNNETLSHIVGDDDRDLDTELPNWREQIYDILLDLNDLGYYKMSLYPHCFYIDKNKNLKTLDFYSVVDKNDPYIPRDKIQGIIGDKSVKRFDDSTINGMIDFTKFFEITMTSFLSNSWIKDNPFPTFYDRLEQHNKQSV